MKILRYGLGLLVVLVALGCQLNSYGTVDTDGLEGYWQFDGNRYDSSINNRYLVLEGGPTFGAGLFGEAVAFDGDGAKSAYEAKSNTAYDVGDADFTIQIWVNFTDLELEQVLVEKWTQDPAVLGYTLTKLSTNALRFAYATAAGEAGVDTPVLALTTGSWHHFAARRDGTTLDLFVDGIVVQSATIGDPVVASGNPLRMGVRVGGAFALKGLVDEVSFWSRALGDAEISAYYNDGAGLQVTGN